MIEFPVILCTFLYINDMSPLQRRPEARSSSLTQLGWHPKSRSSSFSFSQSSFYQGLKLNQMILRRKRRWTSATTTGPAVKMLIVLLSAWPIITIPRLQFAFPLAGQTSAVASLGRNSGSLPTLYLLFK